MATHMSDVERRAFLSEGTRTAILSTTRKDGTPHAAPVWFVLDGDALVFTTGRDSVKARNLRRTGVATLTVDDDRPPYAFVSLTGRVEITDDSDGADVMLAWATRLGGRYMGADRAEEYGRRNAVPEELLIRFVPDKIIALAGIAE